MLCHFAYIFIQLYPCHFATSIYKVKTGHKWINDLLNNYYWCYHCIVDRLLCYLYSYVKRLQTESLYHGITLLLACVGLCECACVIVREKRKYDFY